MANMVPRTAWGQRIREVVLSGKPIAYTTLITETARLVPPGRAYRKRLLRREWLRNARGFTERTDYKGGSEKQRKQDAIRTGSELIVKEAFWEYERAGRLERYTEGDVEMVRSGSNPWPA
jgi:hypothetical protein